MYILAQRNEKRIKTHHKGRRDTYRRKERCELERKRKGISNRKRVTTVVKTC